MSTKIKHLLSVTAIVFFIVIAFASSEGKTIDENEKPVENVTVGQIFTEFAQNGIAAKEKYGKKIIAVRGIVASVESYGDGVVVLLNDGTAENVGVKCYFNEDQQKSVINLKKGEGAKIIGVGGESLLIDYKVNDCRLGALGAD